MASREAVDQKEIERIVDDRVRKILSTSGGQDESKSLWTAFGYSMIIIGLGAGLAFLANWLAQFV